MQQSVSSKQEEDKYPFEEKFKPVTRDPDNAQDFLDEINIYNDRYSEGEWIFRGQNNANWCLVPSIFRDKRILNVAVKELENYIHPSSNDSTIQEISEKGEAYEFILARVCAAVEYDRVNSFIIGLDNADIRIPYNSSFHQHDSGKSVRDIFGSNIGMRVPYRSDFHLNDLKREIGAIVSAYRNLPDQDDLRRSRLAQAMYSHIEQRYLDINFALAQHSGLPTGLLDWTTNPLVAAFYAAFTRDSSDRKHERLVVWAVDSSFFERNLIQTRLIRHPRSYIRNIHAQSAVFTRDADDWRDYVAYRIEPQFEGHLGGLVFPESEHQHVWRITLPFCERNNLLRLLKRSNISISTLEPTHYHVADEVIEQFKEKHEIKEIEES